MGLKDELDGYVGKTFETVWDVIKSEAVPTPEDKLALANKGVEIEACVLYADLAQSTALVAKKSAEFAAEVYKSYVYAAAKSIRYYGGTVTAFDGDRVMGVFTGGQRRNSAIDAACLLESIVEDIIQPKLKATYSASSYKVGHKVGIDDSTLLVTNTGIRGNNDYVWVGPAANNAAKMAALPRGYTTYMTAAVFDVLKERNLQTSEGRALWSNIGSSDLGYSVYAGIVRSVVIPN